MKCEITLFDPKNNASVKARIITVDRYIEAEMLVQSMNKKLKEKYWKVTAINR